jgi:hypothetical protein
MTAWVCIHRPACPPADASDREAAAVTYTVAAQGWSRLCNGVTVFEDTGGLAPDGRVVEPHRSLAATAARGAAA